MKGQVIGKTMLHGYAGSYSRQPDMVVDTHPHGGKADIPFGFPVAAGADGAVAEWAETSTAGNFVGVAVREIKSATDYMNQSGGAADPDHPECVRRNQRWHLRT